MKNRFKLLRKEGKIIYDLIIYDLKVYVWVG